MFPEVLTCQRKEIWRSELERSNDTPKPCELLRLMHGVGIVDLML